MARSSWALVALILALSPQLTPSQYARSHALRVLSTARAARPPPRWCFPDSVCVGQAEARRDPAARVHAAAAAATGRAGCRTRGSTWRRTGRDAGRADRG